MSRKKNKNFCHVNIRENRVCCHCGEVIPKGTNCLTINNKGEGRKWMCNRCEDLFNELNRLSCIKDSLNFGDEGSAEYFEGEYNEVKSELDFLKSDY